MRVVEAGGGGIEDLKVVERPDPPAPKAGQVAVDMLAMSINPADLLLMEGRYGVLPEPPFTPGAEGVARVTAVGEGVSGLSAGDLVIPLAGPAWVERMTVPAAGVIRLPADVDLDQAAMLKANPATALAMLRDIVELEPGDWVAQNAGNSAVGVNVIRLAKAMGLKTLSIVRRQSSVARLKEIGADAVAVHDGQGPLEAPEAPKLAFDAVGGAATNALASIMAEGDALVTQPRSIERAVAALDLSGIEVEGSDSLDDPTPSSSRITADDRLPLPHDNRPRHPCGRRLDAGG